MTGSSSARMRVYDKHELAVTVSPDRPPPKAAVPAPLEDRAFVVVIWPGRRRVRRGAQRQVAH
jgi:hypothetical protein